MRLLVDTHIMLWWMRGDSRLSTKAGRLIAGGDNQLVWSIVSSWEIAVKVSIGKLVLDRPLHRLYADLIGEQKLELLVVGHQHCVHLGTLPLHHRDPFDRMLVAQAQVENIPILTGDAKLSRYEVEIVF
jgi:PIN domain nuclease of toxin-antitoxin system